VARLRTFAGKVKLEEDAALALVRHAQETLREGRLLSSWHSILIAPLLPHLCGADAEELLIIPDLRLSLLPWAALMDEEGRYLAEYHTIRIATSVGVARLLEREYLHASCRSASSPGTSGRRAVVVANPWPLHPQHALESLLHAEAEAVSVASTLRECSWEVDFAKAADATKARVEAMLQDADWVHMACHGLLEQQALVLACDAPGAAGAHARAVERSGAAVTTAVTTSVEDSLLCMTRVQEQVTLRRGCTVVLSACSTACGRVGRGEGVVGLARAFFSAGAAALVVSLWSVGDQSTKQFMSHFYSNLKSGASVALALRLAMLQRLGRTRRCRGDYSQMQAFQGKEVCEVEVAGEDGESIDRKGGGGVSRSDGGVGRGARKELAQGTRPIDWAGFLVTGASAFLV
jgi:CHAT domain-containing protein